MFLKDVSLIDDVQSKIYWEAMFQDDDDDDVDAGFNERTGKMDIKPTIWQDKAIENHQNKDFARYLLNYILMNMIIFKPSAVSCRSICDF